LELALSDISKANVHLSIIGSHTDISGLKKVLEREITVDRIDLVLV
jgi:hypothetical protein